MLVEQGRVVEVDGDGLWVQTQRTSTCSSCSARHGCGHKLLAKADESSVLTRALLTKDMRREPWQIGDRALIAVEERAFLYASLLVFGLPMLLSLTLILALDYFGSLSDPVIALAGLFGLVLGGLIVRFIAHTNVKKRAAAYHAVVTERLTAPVEGSD